MGECENCGKKGEDLSLLLAYHREQGKMMICRECWIKLQEKGLIRSSY